MMTTNTAQSVAAEVTRRWRVVAFSFRLLTSAATTRWLFSLVVSLAALIGPAARTALAAGFSTVAAVDEAGIAQRTIIVFTSDNGGWAYKPRATDPEGFTDVPATSNLPLRSGKASIYEGGTREPLIVVWPELVRELNGLIAGFLNDTGAVVPVKNPNYRPGAPAPAKAKKKQAATKA